MGWSLNYLKPREPRLLDALFLSAGRALHLSNAFESKCQYVLRMANFAEAAQADPVLGLQELIDGLPPDKMLGGTLRDLANTSLGSQTANFEALDGARKARNFIAHEGASVGSMSSVTRDHILENAVRLRTAVAQLAIGDNVVSQWCFHLEEPNEPLPRILMDAYSTMVDGWVFGHFDALLAAEDDSASAVVEAE
ncbi:hypothetical protein OKJ48_07890 [Streptomyces kunmingensis]|uniref:Uncharacterized protein n=1 Tax=Streptomyces kunmingensis TaxID=68225 RepID=A0ABU6C6P6_9ACTN|nr:hypothetical protein [Streptomyces kunmingensis]MEB3960169.1 hypothetical protein [Streptomyces kunmingensis]